MLDNVKARKICVVTATRAEYGLLFFIMKKLQLDPEIEFQLIVTGAHLSPEFGLTYKLLEADGFEVSNKVEMLLSSDSRVGTVKSLALCTIGVAEKLETLQPDVILLCGDRYEMLGAAQAAMLLGIPIAHIAGGDSTIGAFDESIRHAITKMSQLHFVTNETALRRVRQLGENPDLIFNVGSPALEHIYALSLIERQELESRLSFKLQRKNLLITFHPATNSELAALQFQELLNALESFDETVGLLFTQANADPGSRQLHAMLSEFIKKRTNSVNFTNLGQLLYLSLIQQVDAVVGNSSSGLYEVPSFKIPTVNIGDRQAGREKASSVIDCEPNASAIAQAINAAFGMDCSQAINPYAGENSSGNIVAFLKTYMRTPEILKKKFFDQEYVVT